MGSYRLKPWFRARLRSTARALAVRRVTPDQVTTAGIAAAALGGLALVAGRWWPWIYLAVAPLVLARTAANALDGLLAEETGSGRPAGELYNETADRLGDAALLAGTAAVPGVPAALAFGALAAAAVASFVGVAAKAAGGSRRYDGPMGKPDRMLLLGAAGLLAPWIQPPGRVVEPALVVVAAGALVTAGNRYRHARAELVRLELERPRPHAPAHSPHEC